MAGRTLVSHTTSTSFTAFDFALGRGDAECWRRWVALGLLGALRWAHRVAHRRAFAALWWLALWRSDAVSRKEAVEIALIGLPYPCCSLGEER